MDLNEAVDLAQELVKKIESSRNEEWDSKTRFIDLVEEVGELANALLVDHSHKSEKERRAELADSVCDILFDVFIIARQHNMDLNKEYEKVLKDMEKRLQRGDFE